MKKQHHGLLLSGLLISLLVMALPATSHAGKTEPAPSAGSSALKPFHAVYGTALNGIPLGVDLHLALDQEDTGLWSLQFSARSLLFNFTESSHFHWKNCQSTPTRYRFEFDGFGVERSLYLDFDHDNRTARGMSRRGPVAYKMPRRASDELSLAFMARCHLAGGRQEIVLKGATTRGIRTFTFRIDGTETLTVPAGTFETLRIIRVRPEGDTRTSILWVAPALDYIPVRLEHQEKVGMRGILQLKEARARDAGATPRAPR